MLVGNWHGSEAGWKVPSVAVGMAGTLCVGAICAKNQVQVHHVAAQLLPK